MEGGGVETHCQLLWEVGEGGWPRVPCTEQWDPASLWVSLHPFIPRMLLGREL